MHTIQALPDRGIVAASELFRPAAMYGPRLVRDHRPVGFESRRKCLEQFSARCDIRPRREGCGIGPECVRYVGVQSRQFEVATTRGTRRGR